MIKYLLALVILLGSSTAATAKRVGAKGNYLCLAAKINKRIQELQPMFYGKEAQVEAVYCNSVKGDYIVLKENQGNITVFTDVETTDGLIVGETDGREIIIQPETDIYKLDDEYSKFNQSIVATNVEQLTPVGENSSVGNASNNTNNTKNNAPGDVYAD
ncbi:hypothetical protein [Myxosarcina sp. GI1]|uniref:hypothetical protein n=1 Tax=Myxosarcina sp. GI1 TaxID=1541065 RepID=UPI000565EF9D|nr:hypothetical protein [Myxosarcina sp. GI1]